MHTDVRSCGDVLEALLQQKFLLKLRLLDPTQVFHELLE